MTQSKVNTSLMKNSPSTTKPQANKAKPTANKAPAKPAAKSSKAKPSNRYYTRNSAVTSLFSASLIAVVGAAVITGFDVVVNQFAPTISAGIRTTVKGVLGVGFKLWGKKLPLVGAFSDTIGNAFLLATSLDVLSNVVVPRVVAWLAPASVPQTIKDPATGQLGVQMQMPDGSTMQIYDDRNGGMMPYGGMNYGNYSPAVYQN